MASRAPGRTKKEKERRGLYFVYCMYCRNPVMMKDLAVKEGRYDVCRKPECLESYYTERKVKLKRSLDQQRKRQLEENYPDPTWMTGDC